MVADGQWVDHMFRDPEKLFLSPVLPINLRVVRGELRKVHPELPFMVYDLLRGNGALPQQQNFDSALYFVRPGLGEVLVRDIATWLPELEEGAEGYVQHMVTIGWPAPKYEWGYWAERLEKFEYSEMPGEFLDNLLRMDARGNAAVEWDGTGISVTQRSIDDIEMPVYDVDLMTRRRVEPQLVPYTVFGR